MAIKGFLDNEISAKLDAPALVMHKSAWSINKLRFCSKLKTILSISLSEYRFLRTFTFSSFVWWL